MHCNLSILAVYLRCNLKIIVNVCKNVMNLETKDFFFLSKMQFKHRRPQIDFGSTSLSHFEFLVCDKNFQITFANIGDWNKAV